ncbi:DUF72 domain-containing protein [Martelella endophytica]|uniref:DUF72 domain-containing protein n=1 Tax=Martelella endophytica TaxID=1486262 RepID=A0A0D5LU90_MAREN|nr:DUF72 domain-containing protein [Martelella endophytica]AJY46908.1 hypothetical protein TM49_16430 [Martelella endophytica]
MSKAGKIRVGIGGWTFDPWNESFYPDKLPKTRQLDYASEKLAVIEVNGTYYSSQKPATFAKWAASVPDGFIFSLKASRFCTNRKNLSEAEGSIEKFLGQGITELGDRLGPILWQFMPTKKFEADDFEDFLKLLPAERDGIALKHAIEVRHPSFVVPEFVALVRKYGATIVCAEHPEYPMIADVTGDFVYTRLQKGADDNPHCYPDKGLDEWAGRLKQWASGEAPGDLPLLDDARPKAAPRDVYAFFITNGKVRAPAGAMALQERVS